ncbi:hypothetical protein BGZ70_008378 [Mortierella alpina]|uniref:GH16 domain-containing protein n=1 Tax=Mortierella alpina TaxID=64518 RepID=A0A9P6M1J9_MORAP|nr:hypothetical protein BGZ70_008378 [Mortierella alpina]
MRLLALLPSLPLLLLALQNLWVEPVEAGFFASSSSALSCGPSYAPCPASAPCCNDKVCHKTSKQSCSIALGCQPTYSHPLNGLLQQQSKSKKSSKDSEPDSSSCFPLPVCQSFKQKFKHNQADKHEQHRALIPKLDFIGDPDQAYFTSDFDHIAPYAQVDSAKKRLLLSARRDKVKTKSGGGFGARVSSTRWSRYGTFSAKFKSAMMLSNPILGEEISIEITGRDPKTAVTDLYRHSVDGHQGGSEAKSSRSMVLPASLSSVLPSMDKIRTRTRKLKDLLLHTKHSKDSAKSGSDENEGEDNSLEQAHPLKRSMTEHSAVYKIEWTPDMIRWSVDGQVLRTLTSKDLIKQKGYGLPSEPMMLQLTVWDGGYDKETSAWVGGKTDYGETNQNEYVTEVEWIEVSCRDNKESKRHPWPGSDAKKRLAQVEAEEKEKEKEKEKQEQEQHKAKEAENEKEKKAAAHDEKQENQTARGSWLFGRGKGQSAEDHTKKVKLSQKSTKGEPGVFARMVDSLVRTLMRWNFILLVLVGSASYLTDPSRKNGGHVKAHHLKQ